MSIVGEIGDNLQVAGNLQWSYGTVTAVGTTRTDAALLTKQVSVIIGGTAGTNGVRLPNRAGRPSGDMWIVANGTAGTYDAGIACYAGNDADLIFFGPFGGSSGASIKILPNEFVLFVNAGTGWLAMTVNSVDAAAATRQIMADTLKLTLNTSLVATGAVGSTADFGTFSGGLFAGPISYSVRVRPKTADATINVTTSTSSERGAFFTNEGAAGQVIYTLPAADAGYKFTFYVQAAQNMRIVAATGDTIRLGASVSAAAGRIDNATVGGFITLYGINATEWVGGPPVGTWTVT